MTDVLDERLDPTPDEVPMPAPVEATTRADDTELAVPGRVLLAALSAGAGAIHLAMVPSHAAESTIEGIGFAAAGWLQLAFATAVLVRPRRWLLGAAVVANLAFIAAWAVSRTAGLPFGAHAGHAETAGFVDLVTVGLEGATVLSAALLLARPRIGATWSTGALVPASIAPLAVVALASAALVSPSATDHASGAHGDHGTLDTAMASGGTAAAGHDHGDEHTDGHADGHDHGAAGTPAGVDDKGWSQLSNGHQHAKGEVALDAATQAELDVQLDKTRELIARYPTVADAEAAGFNRAGPFAPGLGTHYISSKYYVSPDGRMNDEWIRHPVLIYDGTAPDSKLAGYMYQGFFAGNVEPEGFVGPNDHWHYHTNVCITQRPGGGVDTPFGADTGNISKELCDSVNGRLLDNTGYMVHVWSVPGYESPDGMFTELNPRLTCPDGSYHRIPLEDIGTRSTLCVNS